MYHTLKGAVLAPIDESRLHYLVSGKSVTPVAECSAANVTELKSFLTRMWNKTLVEHGVDECGDLSQSHIPVALFVNAIFGGKIECNLAHMYNIIMQKHSRYAIYTWQDVEQILDITEDSAHTKAMSWPWNHSESFLVSDSCFEQMKENLYIVNAWIDEFNGEYF